MDEELKSFEANDAWDLVDKPQDASVVQCKWVFKLKLDSAGNVTHRARLVAKGFTQKPGVDYDETFSPVVRHSSLRFLIALSLHLDLKITHLDVTTAFLNGSLKETVYMLQPEGFDKIVHSNKVLKLKRAIYGLKQSSRVWYEKVEKILLSLGFTKSNYEPCLFLKNNINVKVMIALYVDDFFIFSNCDKETDDLKRELGLFDVN